MSLDQFEDAPVDSAAPLTSHAITHGATSKDHPEAPTEAILAAPRRPGRYLDDDDVREELENGGDGAREGQGEEDGELEDWNDSDEEWERSLMGGLNEVMDQDWGDVGGDFTKRYNRMRQHVVATHGGLSSRSAASSSAEPTIRPGNLLPATNRPRPARPTASSSANSTTTASNGRAGVHLNKVSDQLASYSHLTSQISLAPLYPTSSLSSRKGGSTVSQTKDKADRATNEQVLDPRTRLIIFKMIGRGLIERIDGCVSTGKEANVYHAIGGSVFDSPEASTSAPSTDATAPTTTSISATVTTTPTEPRHLALKIYKTSILIFKDRDRYVSGEFRFKSGYARSNPRKMVRLWAEKELRNLRRMRNAGLRVPEAIEVRENVLVMEFMGGGEWQASPRLKDAEIPQESLRDLYIEMLVILRIIFSRCKLVHADFSEYNVLYHEGHLWVIDVSQSVEQDHPSAFDFLRSDLQNADEFFARRGVDTLGLTRTFGYVTKKWSSQSGEQESDEEMRKEAERLLDLLGEEEEEPSTSATAALASTSKLPSSATPSSISNSSPQAPPTTSAAAAKPTASDEAVFAQSYIPRFLDQVYDPERDVARVLRGEGDELIYADITGVAKIHLEDKENAKGRFEEEGKDEKQEGQGEDDEDEEESGDDDSGSESGSDDEEEDGVRRPRGKKHEDKDEKKKRRQETKEKAREKRSQKMKKGDKARKVKKTSGKK